MTKNATVTLENYIQEVCEQIVRGVLQAQNDDIIGEYIGVSKNGTYNDRTHSFVTNVKFDVAAEISTNLSGGGKVGLSIAGAEGKKAKEEKSANRISFEIPIGIPLPSKVRSENESTRKKNDLAMRQSAGESWKTV